MPASFNSVWAFAGVAVTCQIADVERIGAESPTGVLAVPGWIMTLDLTQVIQGVLLHVGGNIKSLLPGDEQGMRHMDRVEGDRFEAAPPIGEAAILVLQSTQTGDIGIDG